MPLYDHKYSAFQGLVLKGGIRNREIRNKKRRNEEIGNGETRKSGYDHVSMADSDVTVLDTDSDSDVADIKVERASEIEYEVAGSDVDDVTFSGSEVHVEDDEELQEKRSIWCMYMISTS